MRKYSSIVAFLLAAIMLLSLAACTTPGSSNSTTESDTTDPSKDVVTFSGNYTWKDSVSTLATNWNPHTYETADDSYPLDFIVSGLYTFIYNDALNPVEGKDPYAGYKIVPEMAAAMPVDVTEDIKASHPQFNIPADATSGYAYVIDLNPDAKWQDNTPINADTYIYSMKKLLDPTLINYRATDYVDGDLAIAGGKLYSLSGRTVKEQNSPDGEAMTYEFASLVKGADGVYTTADGAKTYFSMSASLNYLGDSLTTYAKYNPNHDALMALADDEGYVPVTDESTALLKAFITSDDWGNEPESYLGYYMCYDKTYDTYSWDNVGIMKTGEYQITIVLEKSLSGFYLLYNLTGNWLVYERLYEECLEKVGDGYVSSYNTSVETTMSYGPYKLVSYQEDKAMRFEKNENWFGYND
ncbi:MAG: hypothetical protein E7618_08205, partial [Ruminococcaceae bacterium]|nr:hypothetical protein [Oscillospiraceae bacterium]